MQTLTVNPKGQMYLPAFVLDALEVQNGGQVSLTKTPTGFLLRQRPKLEWNEDEANILQEAVTEMKSFRRGSR